MSENTPAQNSRKNISCWIGASPLDARNITPLGAINEPRGLRSDSGNYEVRKTVLLHV